MEITRGKDEWTESTRKQVERLNRMIAELIELSRAEESMCPESLSDFSVSALVKETSDSFQTAVDAQGKKLSLDQTRAVDAGTARPDPASLLNSAG